MARIGIFSRAALAGLTVLAAAGCGKGGAARKDAGSRSEAAMVQGADVLFRADFKAARQAPIYRAIDALDGNPGTTNPAARPGAAQQAAFEKATGLTGEDVDAILVSADIDTFLSEAKASPGKLPETVRAAMAIDLARPLTHDTLKAGVRALTGGASDAGASETTVDGTPALVFKPPAPDGPSVYVALSPDQRTVFATVSKDGLQECLQRASARTYEARPESLAQVETGLPKDAQLRLAVLLPDSVRREIKKRLSEPPQPAGGNPMLGAISGMMTPFQDLQSVAVGVTLAADLNVGLAAALGSEKDAQQVSMMMNAMVLPLLSASLASRLGAQAQDLSKKLQVSTQGSTLSIAVRLTEQDMASGAPAAGAGAAPDSISQGDAPGMKGRSMEEVEAAMGKPRGTLKTKAGVIWFYDDVEVLFKDGRRVSSIQPRGEVPAQ